MNEIRFSQPQKRELMQNNPINSNNEDVFYANKSINLMKKLIYLFFILLLLVGIIFGSFWVKDNLFGGEKIRDTYSAVFLNNGQVYFGKIVSNKKSEMVLNEVFYLQVSDNMSNTEQLESSSNQNQTRFNLVKLGTEMHGPTDEMFINKDHIIFYEYLRDDSPLVESIRSYR